VVLVAIEQPIETSTPAGRCFPQMLGVFAAFEAAIRRERQMEGVAKAKAEGAFKGRKSSIDATRVRELAASRMDETAIAKELVVSRASVYRLIGRNRTTVVAIARPTNCRLTQRDRDNDGAFFALPTCSRGSESVRPTAPSERIQSHRSCLEIKSKFVP